MTVNWSCSARRCCIGIPGGNRFKLRLNSYVQEQQVNHKCFDNATFDWRRAQLDCIPDGCWALWVLVQARIVHDQRREEEATRCVVNRLRGKFIKLFILWCNNSVTINQAIFRLSKLAPCLDGCVGILQGFFNAFSFRLFFLVFWNWSQNSDINIDEIIDLTKQQQRIFLIWLTYFKA